jgi:hypothetical protein
MPCVCVCERTCSACTAATASLAPHSRGLHSCRSLTCSLLSRSAQQTHPRLLPVSCPHWSARLAVSSSPCTAASARPAAHSLLAVTVCTAASFSPCPDRALGLHSGLIKGFCSLSRSARRPQLWLLLTLAACTAASASLASRSHSLHGGLSLACCPCSDRALGLHSCFNLVFCSLLRSAREANRDT